MKRQWFTVPVVGNGTQGSSYRPKYLDRAGIYGFAGVVDGDSGEAAVKFLGEQGAISSLGGRIRCNGTHAG